MDRFIEKNQIFRPDCRVNLKSNMDRFIAACKERD